MDVGNLDLPAIESWGPWIGMMLMGLLLGKILKSILPTLFAGMADQHKRFDETLSSQRKDFDGMMTRQREESASCLTAMKDSLVDLARRCPGGKPEGT